MGLLQTLKRRFDATASYSPEAKSEDHYTNGRLTTAGRFITGAEKQIRITEQIAPLFKGVDPIDRQSVIEMLLVMHVDRLDDESAGQVIDAVARRAKQRRTYLNKEKLPT